MSFYSSSHIKPVLTCFLVFASVMACAGHYVGAQTHDSLQKNKALRIGHLTDLTGIGALLGSQSSFGIALAEQDLKGTEREIKVYTEDHQMNLGQVVTASRKLLEADKVQAVIADLTNPSIAAVGAVESAKKLFLSISPSEGVVNKHKGAYRSFLDYRDGCRLLGKYFKTSGKTSGYIGILGEFGEICTSSLKEENPNLIVEEINSGDDPRSALLRLKNKGVQQLGLIGFEQDLISAVKRSTELKLDFTFGFPTVYLTPLVKQTLGESLKGSIVFGFAPVEKEFIDKVKSRDPEKNLQNIEVAALAYMHTYHLAYALEHCPNQEVSCLALEFERAYQDDIKSPNLLGFKGWKKGLAQFDLSLYRWDGQDLEKIN